MNAVETTRLAAHFAIDSLRAAPAACRWFRGNSASEKAREKQSIKSILGLDPTDQVYRPEVPDRAYLAPQKISTRPQKVTIILPIHNAFDVLQVCIENVIAHTDTAWHLILIDDCSTDPRIKPYLHALLRAKHRDSITLLENEKNLGFVGAVNRGLDAVSTVDAPVVLLNSDALVPKNWASRLIAPFHAPEVASVTPMSNDAEIVSAPLIVTATQLGKGDAAFIDAAAQKFLLGCPPVAIPTGVGFCMALSPFWLRKVPEFDTVFGLGYGEEVDWCRKVLALGGTHLALPSLFVEHRGGQSFGTETKLERVAANNKIITARYPTYDEEVQEFIRTDPLISARLVLALAWAETQQSQPLTVLMTHSLGGGADDAGDRQVQRLLAKGQSVIVLRVGGRTRFEVSLRCRQGVIRAAINDCETLDHIFNVLNSAHFIYGCGVGDSDPTFLPKWLVEQLNKHETSTLEVQLHDFFPISPSYNLLDDDGVYRGVPLGGKNSNPAHEFMRSDNSTISLSDWQNAWGQAISRASKVEVYSQASAEIASTVWPNCTAKLQVRAHAALFDVALTTHTPNKPPKVIGILGNIGHQKGAQVVSDLAMHLKRKKGARLVVVGNIDPQYSVARPAIVHGTYNRKDIARLAESYAIDCWLIPSIWPETFSFATHEALATGLPVWCFDLGGQADAVRAACEARGAGGVISIEGGVPDSGALLHIILSSK